MENNYFLKDNKNSSKNNTKIAKYKKRIYSPSIFAILFGLMILVILISWIIYWVNGSNASGYLHPLGILELFTAPIQGFISSISIIVFLITLGAFMKIMGATQALEAWIGIIFKKLQGKEILIISLVFILFAACGTVFGVWSMAVLPFYFILMPLFTTAGFDKFTAFLVICFGAGIGALASTINPILINTAFDSANNSIGLLYPGAEQIPTSDGLIWRVISFIVLTSFVLGFIIWYALRTRKDITKSIVFNKKNNSDFNFKLGLQSLPMMNARKKITLFCFFATFILLVIFTIPWGSLTGANIFELLGKQLAQYFPYIAGQHFVNGILTSNIVDLGEWSLIEMAFLFLISTFVIGCVNWKGEKDFACKVINGASGILTIIAIISVANGFSILLTESGIQIILINFINEISQINQFLFVIILYLLFFIISVFIPSMSGFAKAIFPTVGPALYTATGGMSISGAILTFSFANGLVHLILPLSAPLIFGLHQANTGFKKYYCTTWFLIIGIILISLSLLMIGTITPIGWF